MRLLKLLLILFVCTAAVSPVWAQAAFDDADAQLRLRQAATAASEAARKVEALRKQLEIERQRVVATDGERDLNRVTINALEQELRGAETKAREHDAALRAAQDARTRGLAAEAERQRLEQERQRQVEGERKKLDEERQRLEAERRSLEEERRRQTEAERQRLEQERQRQVAVERQKLNEERQRLEAERRGLEEERRRKVVQPPTALPTPTAPAPPSTAAVARRLDDAKVAYKNGNQYAAGGHDVTAASWYRTAADLGHGDAQFTLGFRYADGRGVLQDNVQAHMWFALAAAQGDESAGKHRDRLATKMTPAQLAEAQRLAREWRPKPGR